MAGKGPEKPTGADRRKFQAMVRDLHMRIGFDGTWYYHNSPIRRLPLVKLFATVLQRDDAGEYWLITPVEKGRIEVEDVPFVAVEMTVEGEGRDRSVTLRTNIDENVVVGTGHPLRFDRDPATGEPRPYVHVRRGLEARLSRPVYYELVDLGEETPADVGDRRRGFRGRGLRCLGRRPVLADRQPRRDGAVNRPFIAGVLAGSLPRLRDPLDPAAAVARRRPRLRGDHIVDARVRIPAELRNAAVLVPLIDYPAGIRVLLTRRTDDLPHHAGQVAFPGGRLDDTDRDPVHTALREAEEEIGLPPGAVDVVGRLDDYITGTGYVVAPIVGFVEPGADYVPDPSEVDDVFEVPLGFFMDPANHKRETKRWKEIERTFYAMHWNGRYIWGATAAMLVNLYEVLTRKAAA